jgi:hypothetical protein
LKKEAPLAILYIEPNIQLYLYIDEYKIFSKSKRKKSPLEFSLAHVSADHFFVPRVGYLCRDCIFDPVNIWGRIEISVN